MEVETAEGPSVLHQETGIGEKKVGCIEEVGVWRETLRVVKHAEMDAVIGGQPCRVVGCNDIIKEIGILVKNGIEWHTVALQREVIERHVVPGVAIWRVLAPFHTFLQGEATRAFGIDGINARHAGAKRFHPVPIEHFHLFFFIEK